MQRLHRLLNRRVLVEAVNLQKIDVVHLQALQAVLDSIKDGTTGETPIVDVVLEVGNLGIPACRLSVKGFADIREAKGWM